MCGAMLWHLVTQNYDFANKGRVKFCRDDARFGNAHMKGLWCKKFDKRGKVKVCNMYMYEVLRQEI